MRSFRCAPPGRGQKIPCSLVKMGGQSEISENVIQNVLRCRTGPGGVSRCNRPVIEGKCECGLCAPLDFSLTISTDRMLKSAPLSGARKNDHEDRRMEDKVGV